MKTQQYSLEYYQSKKNYKEWKQLGEKVFNKYFPTLKGNWKEDKSNWRWIMYDRYNDKPNETLKQAAKEYKKSILQDYYNVDDMKGWWDLDLTEIDKLEDDSKIKPQHYKSNNDVIQFCLDNELTFCEANVVKYVVRWKKKNGVEDLRKAIEYINRLIAFEAKQNES